jgi:hypothetical protein
MNRLDETQKDATGKGLSDSGYKTESNANGSDIIEADYEEICKALAPSISPEEYRRVTENVDAQTVEKDLFLQRILLNEALLPLRMVLPEGTSKTGLLLKVKLNKSIMSLHVYSLYYIGYLLLVFRTSKN